MTTLFENPLNASAGVRIPHNTSNTREQSAIRSERIFPIMKKMADKTSITIVAIIFQRLRIAKIVFFRDVPRKTRAGKIKVIFPALVLKTVQTTDTPSQNVTLEKAENLFERLLGKDIGQVGNLFLSARHTMLEHVIETGKCHGPVMTVTPQMQQ